MRPTCILSVAGTWCIDPGQCCRAVPGARRAVSAEWKLLALRATMHALAREA
jgi:hypothetical protein